MHFLKYFIVFMGLFVALSSVGVAVGKLMFPARVGVWVGPSTGFVIGVPSPGPNERELLGDAFAPVFTLIGVLLGRSSWHRLRRLRDDRAKPAENTAALRLSS